MPRAGWRAARLMRMHDSPLRASWDFGWGSHGPALLEGACLCLTVCCAMRILYLILIHLANPQPLLCPTTRTQLTISNQGACAQEIISSNSCLLYCRMCSRHQRQRTYSRCSQSASQQQQWKHCPRKLSRSRPAAPCSCRC